MVGLYKDSIADSRAQDRSFPSNFTAPDQEADEPFSSSCLVWRAMQQAQKKADSLRSQLVRGIKT
jgi:hypothetical protein